MSAADIKEIEVPFDPEGDQQHRAHPYKSYRREDNGLWEHRQIILDWRRQTGPFEDVMIFKQLWMNSSGVASWHNAAGNTFWMANSEFTRIIPFMTRGVLAGKFYFTKQGKHFSLRYLDA